MTASAELTELPRASSACERQAFTEMQQIATATSFQQQDVLSSS